MLIRESLEKIPVNPNEKRLGEYLIEQGILLENATVRTVAKEVFLAPSSVVRFVQKLGFEGFNDFKKQYLEEIAKEYPSSKIIIGGHSKGGNIAVYAATFASKEVKDRIINVYNNDGPGFCEDVIETPEYQEILPRVHTYIPQSSIIGRLMNHKDKYTIVESVQKGIMQHDLYSWQLLGAHFIEDTLTNSSEFIDQTITNWLNEVSPEQREKFIDTLFEILNATEAKTLAQLSSKKFETAKIILSTYKNIDEESKEIISKTLLVFFHIAKNNIKLI